MSHRLLVRLLAVAIFGSSFCVPSVSEAGPLLDWLFQRREARREAREARRLALSPTDGCGCGAAYCEQTVVNYVPQTAYRTVWQPVPVTTYKRTTRCNPTTGLPITCVQPCTNYTYQARRVPYTSYRPIYSTVPVTVPSQNISYMPAAGASGCGSCSSGTSSQYSSIPNYGSPGYSVPSSSGYDSYSQNPPGATPWRGIDRTPSNSGYDDYDRRSNDPADQRPSLGDEPIIQQNSYSRALQRIPSTSRDTAGRYGSDPYYDGQSQSSRNQDRSIDSRFDRDTEQRRSLDTLSERSARGRQNFRSDDRMTSRYTRIDRDSDAYDSLRDGNSTSVLKRRSTINRSDSLNRDIQPVPNMAPRRSAPPTEIPPLLNTTRDREASVIRPIATRWASNKIYWNEVARVELQRYGANAVRQASAEEPVVRPLRRDTERYQNDDRWESVKTNRKPATDAGWSAGR